MLYELDDVEKRALMESVVDRARADLNDGRPLTEMRAERLECICHKFIRLHDGTCPVHGFVRKQVELFPGERIQTWFCEDCQEEHTGSVLGGPIGDQHGETSE